MSERSVHEARREARPTERALFIRLQALGDVMIPLPYIQGVKRAIPDAQVEFLTREENAPVPRSLSLFSRIHALRGGRNTRKQAIHAVLLGLVLRKRNYDVVVDLQNNRISRIITTLLAPPRLGVFDRLSPVPAGVRTASAIEQALQREIEPVFDLKLTDEDLGVALLESAGWRSDHILVVLNPAGFLPSRNWPLDNYIRFSRQWMERYPRTQFVITGLDRIRSKADVLQKELGDSLIDLVGNSTAAEAFAVIQKASVVVSEDSGLMHMAWISGKPTIALFGSSRSDWSRPLGEHSFCFSSADMECGECMQPECKFGDVRCLTRITPEMVLEQASNWLDRREDSPSVRADTARP